MLIFNFDLEYNESYMDTKFSVHTFNLAVLFTFIHTLSTVLFYLYKPVNITGCAPVRKPACTKTCLSCFKILEIFVIASFVLDFYFVAKPFVSTDKLTTIREAVRDRITNVQFWSK